MTQYELKKFNIPEISGISKSQIEEHLKLYGGYVAHTNKIISQISTWQETQKDTTYIISELRRRLGFEFDGMKNHEYYFGALESGPAPLSENHTLGDVIKKQFGSIKKWQEEFISVGKTRGSGWALLMYDSKEKYIINAWVDEHHLGHLSSLSIVLAMDCWEHAYMVDYLPGEREAYINAYLTAVNFDTVDGWFKDSYRE
jgi:Fe-Mn family superoxide dismutase